MLLETYPADIRQKYIEMLNEKQKTALDIASKKGYTEIVALIKCFANPENKSEAATNKANTVKRDVNFADSNLKSNVDVILKNFKANTTNFTNAKDKSFKENQIINITLDDVIKQFSNTSLNALIPVFHSTSHFTIIHKCV